MGCIGWQYFRGNAVGRRRPKVQKHGLHRVAVATRELALDKGAEEGQAKADVRRYKKKSTYARKNEKYLEKRWI